MLVAQILGPSLELLRRLAKLLAEQCQRLPETVRVEVRLSTSDEGRKYSVPNSSTILLMGRASNSSSSSPANSAALSAIMKSSSKAYAFSQLRRVSTLWPIASATVSNALYFL